MSISKKLLDIVEERNRTVSLKVASPRDSSALAENYGLSSVVLDESTLVVKGVPYKVRQFLEAAKGSTSVTIDSDEISDTKDNQSTDTTTSDSDDSDDIDNTDTDDNTEDDDKDSDQADSQYDDCDGCLNISPGMVVPSDGVSFLSVNNVVIPLGTSLTISDIRDDGSIILTGMVDSTVETVVISSDADSSLDDTPLPATNIISRAPTIINKPYSQIDRNAAGI